LVACFEVAESGDDLGAVVDGVAASAALPEYLPVFESGDDVFDAWRGAARNWLDTQALPAAASCSLAMT